ncbi:AraC family transcriptional regulator [Jiulongibacter sp. NS-SX5]|uniref:AraC family transcriptional regulator n=1 Tax=Jiulongibacter sp. NS-SX5 TaxID=3463854 RepID=UPI004057EFC8
MALKNELNIRKHLQHRKLEDMVENRTSYTIDFAELNIYETHQKAESVNLTFSDPVLASMIRGKKVMHLKDQDPFEFFPNESVIVGGGETMGIDFPEATMENPTQCLALALSSEKILKVVAELNEKTPLIDDKKGWTFDDKNFYFTNDDVVNYLLTHLIEIFTEDNRAKDVFAEYTLKELIIRLMQTKARVFLMDNLSNLINTNRLAHALQYIEDRMHENISVAKLADQSCMSEANFYRCFKNQLGISPVEYMNQKRIERAKKMLSNIENSIADTSLACGFNSLNHFFKLFKKYTGYTPANFRKDLMQKTNLPLSYITGNQTF